VPNQSSVSHLGGDYPLTPKSSPVFDNTELNLFVDILLLISFVDYFVDIFVDKEVRYAEGGVV